MSKLQLITKAIITAIGVSTAAGFLRNIYLYPQGETHILFLAIGQIILLLAFAAIIYWLIFKNDWLVRKITSENTLITLADQKRTLAIWLRLLLVFSGLHLLTNSSRAFRLLLYLNPVKIRAWVQGLFAGDYPQFSYLLSKAAWTNFCHILILALIIYLLLGAPHLVRWHIKRLSVTNNNTDLSGGNDNE